MKLGQIAIMVLFLSACASGTRQTVQEEHAQEQVRHMQDEFNRLTNDAN